MSQHTIIDASTFNELGVPSSICKALDSIGITTPTPIQAATLPDSLNGRDVLGKGRTGSGKTFAFLVPVISHLITEQYRPEAGRPRTLVLAPTRELASQIEESLKPLKQNTKITSQTIFGGVGQGPQVKAIRRGLDVAIATPGRLEDLMRQREIDLSGIEIVVIDEADQMADMGFLPTVKKILNAVSEDAQHILFSATLDNQVQTIVKQYLHNPIVHETDSPEEHISDNTDMEHHALRVKHDHKSAVIADLCATPSRSIVFTKTKHGAKNLSRKLTEMGVPALELHGNLSQGARTRNLDAFHAGKVNTLVATDIAARGIHVDDIGIVIHADPPAEHKAYVHRSGRTARAGNSGVVVTIVSPEKQRGVKNLMRKAGINAEWNTADAESDILFELSKGERVYMDRADAEEAVRNATPRHRSDRNRSGNGGANRSGKKRRPNNNRNRNSFNENGNSRNRHDGENSKHKRKNRSNTDWPTSKNSGGARKNNRSNSRKPTLAKN